MKVDWLENCGIIAPASRRDTGVISRGRVGQSRFLHQSEAVVDETLME